MERGLVAMPKTPPLDDEAAAAAAAVVPLPSAFGGGGGAAVDDDEAAAAATEAAAAEADDVDDARRWDAAEAVATFRGWLTSAGAIWRFRRLGGAFTGKIATDELGRRSVAKFGASSSLAASS